MAGYHGIYDKYSQGHIRLPCFIYSYMYVNIFYSLIFFRSTCIFYNYVLVNCDIPSAYIATRNKQIFTLTCRYDAAPFAGVQTGYRLLTLQNVAIETRECDTVWVVVQTAIFGSVIWHTGVTTCYSCFSTKLYFISITVCMLFNMHNCS